ncbi:MAG TPA: alanine racemase [Actinomycetota bacterium]|nr:alanine racemase [Actinomycetota bacterium]
MAERGHPVWAEVDLGAITANARALVASVGRAEVMGVVKGYAYGHGNPASANAILAGGATRLGVARVAEALHLREAGIGVPIHVFTEPPPEAAATLISHDLIPTIYTDPFARALDEAARAAGKRVPFHLKIDTGMHRVGLMVSDLPSALEALGSYVGLELEGAWSHLAVADEPDHPFTRKQLDLFVEVTESIERAGYPLRYRHIANSAATLSMPDAHLDMVRCGIACFGLSPGDIASPMELRPALALRARANMIKEVPAGEALSYGLQYELKRSGRVVTVPAGYADGYSRAFSGKADVLIGGIRYRLSGTVCMDQFMVDIGADEAAIGDVVTLVGTDGDDAITAEELARLSGTINYEITTRIPSRVPRIYIPDAKS